MARKLRLHDFLPYQLSIAANAVSQVIAAAYEEKFGLTVPEWRLIAVLHEAAPATQKDLVDLTLMDKVAVSRAAISLAKRRLILRQQDPEDGRAWRLSLSARGNELYDEIAPAALDYERRLIASLKDEDIRRLKDVLARLVQSASEFSD